MSDQVPDEVWVCRDVTGALYLRTGRPSPLEPDDTLYIRADLYEQAEADCDTLGAHLERTQARVRGLESKVTDCRALTRRVVDVEADRDRLRAVLADIADDPYDYQRVQDAAQEALGHE